jgi:hypothetical protein
MNTYIAEQEKRGKMDVLAERSGRRAIANMVGEIQNSWKKAINIRSTGTEKDVHY